MTQIKEIKLRIESVTKTKKLTQAMKMVAAAKFKRSQQAVTKTNPYINELDTILEQLLLRMDADEIPALFNKDNTSDRTAIIVVSSDRGLCGGFNASLFKGVDKFLKQTDLSKVDAFLIGNKSIAAYKKRGFGSVTEFPFFVDSMTPKSVIETFGHLLSGYEENTYKEVRCFYNKFLSGVSFETRNETLLPFDLDDSKSSDSHSDFIYEPSKSQILSRVGKEIIFYKLYKSVLESKASEEGSRMAAMESATDNAGEMIKDLTLLYNRSRQAQITKEISEIVAGANASS